MGFYDVAKNCDAYTEMAKGFDGRELVVFLREHLATGRVLELGMGPGVDQDLLRETFDVVGSDSSKVFVDRYREKHPDADVRILDVLNLEHDLVGEQFDAIYTNKVLHHIYPDELTRSLTQQAAVLKTGGLMLHTFWVGEPRSEEGHGMLFTYYDEPSLRAAIPDTLEVVDLSFCQDMERDDSYRLLLRKR